ncbi:MAG TPA: hypothetical protein VK543_03160 [Puia sp.]|nr:hypothetical protein [Puia sp.]
MRKIFFIVLLSVPACTAVQACDICGCGGGNLYLGLLPNFKSRFIGIRYQYAQYHTELANDHTQFSHNYYNSIEVWGGWNIGKKWQILGFIPYYFNKQADDDGTSYKNGLGDISLLANYQLLHTKRTTDRNNSVEQEFWVGAGLKLPTGTFRLDVSDPTTTVADVNAQIGTGSVDFLFNAVHHIRINQFGINTTANYKVNTANSADYKYGNKLTASSIGYYRFRFHGMAAAPNIGVVYENTEANALNKQRVEFTGGYVVSGLVGVEFSFNKVAVGFNEQGPIGQHYAGGQTRMQLRGMGHVSFVF